MEQIKVVIADDQSLMRDGLATILELEPDIEVVGKAVNGEEAYQLVNKQEPDLILMDIRMPEMDGIESTRQIKKERPETAVLALTTFDDQEYIVEILNSGAEGYLLKDIDGDKLVQAIKDAVAGDLIMPSEVASKLAANVAEEQTENDEDAGEEAESKSTLEGNKEVSLNLSEREREVARMLAKGFTNKQIASALYISYGTVKNYVSEIYNKIGVSDRTKVALYLQEKLAIKTTSKN